MIDLFPFERGLGVNFTLHRRAGDGFARAATVSLVRVAGAAPLLMASKFVDLVAISHLDAVRTADLKQSLEILGKPMTPDMITGEKNTPTQLQR